MELLGKHHHFRWQVRYRYSSFTCWWCALFLLGSMTLLQNLYKYELDTNGVKYSEIRKLEIVGDTREPHDINSSEISEDDIFGDEISETNMKDGEQSFITRNHIKDRLQWDKNEVIQPQSLRNSGRHYTPQASIETRGSHLSLLHGTTELGVMEDIHMTLQYLGVEKSHTQDMLPGEYRHTSQLNEDNNSGINGGVICIDEHRRCQKIASTSISYTGVMVLIASCRFDDGIHLHSDWKAWTEYLYHLFKGGNQHFLAATSQFDIEFTRFYTNIEVSLLPPLCVYINDHYNASRVDFLIFPFRRKSLQSWFMKGYLNASLELKSPVPIQTIDDIAARDLVKFQAIVFLPSTLFSIVFMEYYRMNIPLFVPSTPFLVSLHLQHNIFEEEHLRNDLVAHRKWNKHTPTKSGRNGTNAYPSYPDPREAKDPASLKFWLAFADFQAYPNIIHFDSMQELIIKMRSYRSTGKLKNISNQMKVVNEFMKNDIVRKWKNALKSMNVTVK